MQKRLISKDSVRALSGSTNRCFAVFGDYVVSMAGSRRVARYPSPFPRADRVKSLFSDDRWIVLGTHGGRLYRLEHLDPSPTWKRCNTPMKGSPNPVSASAFDVEGNLWVGGYGYLFYQRPFSSSWRRIKHESYVEAMCPTSEGDVLACLSTSSMTGRLVRVSTTSRTPALIARVEDPREMDGAPGGPWYVMSPGRLWKSNGAQLRSTSLSSGRGQLFDVFVGRSGVYVGTETGLFHSPTGKKFSRIPSALEEIHYVTGTSHGLYVGGPEGLDYLPMDASPESLVSIPETISKKAKAKTGVKAMVPGRTRNRSPMPLGELWKHVRKLDRSGGRSARHHQRRLGLALQLSDARPGNAEAWLLLGNAIDDADACEVLEEVQLDLSASARKISQVKAWQKALSINHTYKRALSRLARYRREC